jgi:hypothetical protein
VIDLKQRIFQWYSNSYSSYSLILNPISDEPFFKRIKAKLLIAETLDMALNPQSLHILQSLENIAIGIHSQRKDKRLNLNVPNILNN